MILYGKKADSIVLEIPVRSLFYTQSLVTGKREHTSYAGLRIYC